MPSKSKFTRDDNGNIAVRVVSNDSSVTNSDSMFTTDENGNVAVRVVGSGGGDQHNLGYYETPEALRTAHPIAEAGDFAVVNSTDTIWIWDADTSAWKDGDVKGQVTSVNNQTGAVTITDTDILPSQTGHSGQILGTDGFVAGWVKPEIVQRSTMPQASEDELGNIYQFKGTTDANYTNGYFYKCVSDGLNPATYSWAQTNVQPTPSGLPDQAGNAGKFLTTDGTDAGWSTEVKDTLVVKKTGSENPKKIFVYNNGTSDKLTIFAYQNGYIRISNSDSSIGSGTFTFGNGLFTFGTTANQVTLGESGVPIADIITSKINGKSASSYATTTVPAIMPTLAVADWISNTQTVNVTGVTASNIVFVSPAPASASDYAAAGIVCTAQGAGTLTFTCTTVPSNAITVNVVILG